MANLHAVTGAFGYSGKYIAQRLLGMNESVITLTNSLHCPNPFGERLKAYPFNFDNPAELTRSLRGVAVLYNTYWVRFNHQTFTHADAIVNTLKLFSAAQEAGVKRIVHVSITNPDLNSPLEYFRGKAQLEQALINSGVSYAILRPTVLFGKEDILINGAVGELGWHNPYAYANGNPTNLVDPGGLCAQPTQWWNPADANCYYSAVGLAQRFSQGNPQAYNAWFDVLIKKDWAELKAIEAVGSFADVTGASRKFLDDAAIIPRLFRENPLAALQALQQYSCQNRGTIQGLAAGLILSTVQSAAQVGISGSSGGAQIPGRGVVVVVVGAALAVGGLIIWDELTRPRPYEYRLAGLPAKVNDLALHLAKLLEYDVAGHPPSDPNPYRRPDRGWCLTIRRIIEEIDNTDYTEKQFNRDIEQAGIGIDKWNLIRKAVKEVIAKGLCDDHWGNFSGGSLAH